MNSTNTINYLKTHLFFLPLLTIIFITAYHTTLSWMYGRYLSADSYYSHGFIIPLISVFLIWQKRKQIGETEFEFSWWGLWLILAAVLIHITGAVLYVFSVSGFSIFFLIIGLSLFIFGKKITRLILFPLMFLVFMFPLPLAFISAISFPLKMMVAKTGTDVVSFLGIPVFREGFTITIPAGSLLVGNPCSGLRSLIAFMALGSVFAYMVDFSLTRKIILFLSSIPIAILSNIVRVPILILISHYWGLEAAAPDSYLHTASGIFVFVIGLGMIITTIKILQWKS